MKSVYWLPVVVAVCGITAGCSRSKENKVTQTNLAPAVNVETPQVRDIHRLIAQPGAIQPYEQTAIHSKVSGFVQKWHVDIGHKVKKGDLLIELLVPELAEEHLQKVAQVDKAKAVVQQSTKLVTVAESNSQAAKDAVVESRVILSGTRPISNAGKVR